MVALPSPRQLTVVLDDDPTGTQAAADVTVLYRWTASDIVEVLRAERAVFLQTNSRALDQADAVRQAEMIRGQVADAEAALGEPILVVQRGDSTLRGHVFAELDVFLRAADAALFVPAYPGIGRRTVDGVHMVDIAGAPTPAAETEFAREPVFGYRSSSLVDYAREKGARSAERIPLAELRRTQGAAVTAALVAGALVVPDAETEEDIALIHDGLATALADGRRVVVRGAASLAALCAGRRSTDPGSDALPAGISGKPVLVVCGSHTTGARDQVRRVVDASGVPAAEVSTDRALDNPVAAAMTVIGPARATLKETGVAIVSTERERRAEHGGLDVGERVMSALMQVVRALGDEAAVFVTKGGITSAEVASVLDAPRARVRGQLLPGVSVLDLATDRGTRTQIVVPGNVGDVDTLAACIRAIETSGPRQSPRCID